MPNRDPVLARVDPVPNAYACVRREGDRREDWYLLPPALSVVGDDCSGVGGRCPGTDIQCMRFLWFFVWNPQGWLYREKPVVQEFTMNIGVIMLPG